MVAASMINNVNWLDELSQTSKLWFGLLDEGKIKGNMLTPTVAIMPNMDRALEQKAMKGRFASKIASSAKPIPKIGTICVIGIRE